MILIGNGGHASDIAEFTTFTRQFEHHRGVDTTGVDYILGINDPHVRAEACAAVGGRCCSWVHPDAHLYHDVVIGEGTHINYGVHAVRTTFGEHCTISPGVTICGDVVIGDRVFVGANATIVNLAVVPDDTFIKAGTVWAQRGD